MIRVAINPQPAIRMTQRGKWGYAAQRYLAYKLELKLKLRLLRYELPETLPDIVFNLEMPRSWPDSKKAIMAGQPHQQKPDIDNLLKGFMDSLGEDSHVWKIQGVEKRWAHEGSIVIGESNEAIQVPVQRPGVRQASRS